ncbi:hypothetical protein ACQCX2_11710 [Propionibacteriaceae bacterium Y1700]|uniref:hypothetical protein n=1 Tax=Microlunatus sp. Y1700 TaxID=3418487 RepID=UPI003DA749CC
MQHRIPPRFPYPAMLVVAAVEVIAFIVIASTTPPWQYLGWVLLLLAAAAASWVIIRWGRSGLVVDLSDDGWAVRANGTTMDGRWSDIAQVSATDERVRLIPVHGKSVVIESPGGADKNRFATLLTDITDHLDRHRRG